MDYQKILKLVLTDERYRENIEFEYPVTQSGHPERKVSNHIAELEVNLEKLKNRLSREEDYWKLKFLIHVHDTFKAKASREGVSTTDPRSHESLAREFASEYIDDADMLNIIQYHDENYTLWKGFKKTGNYDRELLEFLLDTILDWDLYLAFAIIDGHTAGKDIDKLDWFIKLIKKYKKTNVDETWTKLITNNK